MSPRSRPQGLPVDTRFLGGPACLDFANTTEQLDSDRPHDWFTSYTILLTWSRARGTLGTEAASRLAGVAQRGPAAAAQSFAKAVDLRRDIRALATALADRRPADAALRRVNTWLVDLPAQPPIAPPRAAAPGRFTLSGASLDEPLWPILWSLTALLTSAESARVRRCEGLGCGYFFVDTTTNRSRRFCSTEGCGNRARARRFHRLHRKSVPGA
jgi:predicted RNA-binding Zn ribbon-like protein